MASCTPRKNKNGIIISYQIKVSRGRDPETGKQLSPYTMTYYPPYGWNEKSIEQELRRVAGEFEAACNRGEVLTKEQAKNQRRKEAHEATFAAYVQAYLEDRSTVLAATTIEAYRVVLNHASSVFGEMKMTDIGAFTLKQYMAGLKHLAYKTVSKYYLTLHGLFANAVQDEVIPFNPMQNMKRPKPPKDELAAVPLVYDEDQVKYIMKCLDKEPLRWKALILFAIDSGCRRGEIAALKWSEIDFETGRCNICRNAQYLPSKGVYLSTPKSRNNRTIYLNRPILNVLAEWRKQQAIQLLAKGAQQSGFCFTCPDGTMLKPQAFTDYLQRFGRKYNLPGIHPHALRHTMATLSIANGADIVSVSKKLGHSTPSITLDVYSHANEEAQRRANEILAHAIYQKQ